MVFKFMNNKNINKIIAKIIITNLSNENSAMSAKPISIHIVNFQILILLLFS